MSDAIITDKIIQRLYARHSGYEWACFAELRSSTGAEYTRTFDFWVMNTWPSQRFETIGYEVKASRADFVKEMNNPKKREKLWNYSNQCYFVAPSGIIHKDEVPEGWGLIEMIKNGLRRKKVAQYHEAEMPIGFVASILRERADRSPRLPDTLIEYLGKELPVSKLVEMANSQKIAELERELIQRKREIDILKDQRTRSEKMAFVWRVASQLAGFTMSDEDEVIEKRLNDSLTRNWISWARAENIRHAMKQMEEILQGLER